VFQAMTEKCDVCKNPIKDTDNCGSCGVRLCKEHDIPQNHHKNCSHYEVPEDEQA